MDNDHHAQTLQDLFEIGFDVCWLIWSAGVLIITQKALQASASVFKALHLITD